MTASTTDRKPLTEAAKLKLCREKAQAKSRERDPRLTRTRRVGCGTYEVVGDTGLYIVTVDARGYTCGCRAGQNERVCWHCFSVYRVRLVEKMRRDSAAPADAVSTVTVKSPLPTLESMYAGIEGN